MVGVSPDPVEDNHKFRVKYDISFPLLSDLGHAVADRYGAWGEKKMYGKTYMGINRSHFLVDEQGKLLDVQIRVTPKDSVQRAIDACCAD